MKQNNMIQTQLFLVLLIGLVLHGPASGQNQPAENPVVSGENKTVLIFNSYRPETKWSEEVANGLKQTLSRQFPGIHLYSGNLNIEENATSGTLLFSLRAIIWQMAEQEGVAINPEDQSKTSFYQIRKRPDVIVCIGEEAYFSHQALHLWQSEWSNIPIVQCAVNDSLSATFWHPENPTDLSFLREIEDPKNREIHTYLSKKQKANLDSMLKSAGLELKAKSEETDKQVIISTRYHTTGVFYTPPIRENLELLNGLMPEIREIVWVDNYYYKNAYILYKLKQLLPQVLPQAKLSVLHHDRLNTDSIFNAMLAPVPNRAFITYAWNINGIYSRHPETVIDSLFCHQLTSPILTLTERQMNNSYWLGGVYIPTQSIIQATARQVSRILNGEPADSIPFIQIKQTETSLNVPALKRFGLEKKARQMTGISYKNIPPSFYQRHEKVILISLLIVILFAGFFILLIKRMRYTRKIKTEYFSNHRLYKRLQTIYQNTGIDFALYDNQGRLLTKIIDGKENNTSRQKEILFPEQLFTHPQLSKKSKQLIQLNQMVQEEIETSASTSSPQEKQRWNLIVKPLKNDNHQVAFMVIALDLTPLLRERKAKERSEHIFQFATETAEIGVASYNLLNNQGFASPNWFHNLNEAPQTNTLPTYQNVCEDDREALLAYQQEIRKTYNPTPFVRIIKVKGAHGQIHYVQEYIFVREYAPERQTISVVELNLNYDIPQQQENELRLAKEKAEASNMETEQFLANISHEIRTPLNAIVGFSSILANSTDEEEMNTLSPIIEQNNSLLMDLIDNILYLSKLDSETLTFSYTQTDPVPLFDNLVKYTQELSGNKGISIVAELPSCPKPIYMAETQFRLLMTNLLSNAVKFTSHGCITLGYEERGKEYYFFVKDTGCGIHIVDQEEIFKRFNKLDVFTQGTGLGLALCRSIVNHQQGKIGVISNQGGGSTFWFTLPLVSSSASDNV